MTFEIVVAIWPWVAATAAGAGTIAGVWWALADFILDRMGPAPTEWSQQRRG